MRHLFLVRHAAPTIIPGMPAAQWPLSDAGRAAAVTLARQISGSAISSIVSSREPKAIETANILAAWLRLPATMDGGLNEHDRTTSPYLDRDEFETTISRFFDNQKELIFGAESAAQALKRFTSAVEGVVAQSTNGNGDLLIVTHGTVLTLFVAAHNPIVPLAFWRQLAQPDLVTLRLPDFRLLTGPSVGASPGAHSLEKPSCD